jgi:hypothetical protein
MDVSLDLREAVRAHFGIELETLEHWHTTLDRLRRELDRALSAEEAAEQEVSEQLAQTIDAVSCDLWLAKDEVGELIKALVQSVTYRHRLANTSSRNEPL